MKKNIKKILKVLGIFLLIILVALIAYLIYLFASYHRIPDNQASKIEKTSGGTAAADTLTTEKEYSALTYNVGFGAYTPDFSFFMDGGKSSWAKSKESVEADIQGAGELVASKDPDFTLIQEVDLNSTRSYHVDEYSILKDTIPSYNTVFAQNYDSAFLFYPFTQPHGRSRSGLALFSKYPVTDSLRRSFPISTSFSKFFDLDRCYSISRVPVDNGKELVIFLLHMSAYGNSDAIREGQIRMLSEIWKRNTKPVIMYFAVVISTMTLRHPKKMQKIVSPGLIHSHAKSFQNTFHSAWTIFLTVKRMLSGTVHGMQIWNMYLV